MSRTRSMSPDEFSWPSPASKACNSHCHNINFKVANTVVTAALRFRSSSRASSLGHQSSHEVRLNVDITSDEDTHDLEFDPAFVKSLAGFVDSRDLQKLKDLGGVKGLARLLHTDLARGLPIGQDVTQSKLDVLASRKRVFGENAYPMKAGKTLWEFLWEARRDTTLNILMLCAAFSLGLGIESDGIETGWYDGVSISVAIVLVIVVTAISNYGQSSWKFQHLKDNIQVQAVRGGCQVTVPILDIVVGDIVKLKIGDQIPADGLLVQGRSLAIDESNLTGEGDYYIPDSDEQAFLQSGCKIQDGYGSMLVTGVGINTEWGRMMALISGNSSVEETPLQARLREATTLIGKVGFSVALVVLIILIIFYFTGQSSTDNDPKLHAGQSSATDVMDALVHIFSVAVTIVVVAVPESLPLTVTLMLAYSMKKMMLDKTLNVRHLTACETMGCATTICSDKTGTLTLNQMTVVQSWVAGKTLLSEEQEEFMKSLPSHLQGLLFQGIAQNSTGSIVTSDNSSQQVEVMGPPTEKALLCWGMKAGMSFQGVRAESTILTFNSTKKRAGVAVKTHDKQVLVHWKGDAEIILSMCNKWMDTEDNKAHERQMFVEKRQELEAMIGKMASCGLRCVALATCTTCLPESGYGAKVWRLPEADLTLLAVVGMKDPCRPGAKGFVDAIKAAGVKVRMVTGDNLATAKAIASECGIFETETDQLAVEGAVFQSWTESERKQKLPRVAVVARARPFDKLLLVETLQSMGDVVAVTGDGTDDALALYKADIGLSMGIQGTEVAKEISDIIIRDDNFESVVRVVRWGRCVNFNIQKFLQFQLAVNMTTLVVNLVAAVSSLTDVPMTVGHVLWVNLIMGTVGALALAREAPMDVVMKKPRKEPGITFTVWRDAAVLAMYQVVIVRTLQFKGVDLLHLSGDHNTDIINRAVLINIFVFCQIFNEMNARQQNDA